jgi:dTDP-4-amino-4,6-dideoxygalactose transaminase
LKIDASSAPLTRDDLMTRLAAEGIQTRPGTHAVHTLDYYRRTYGISPEDFPHARDAADTTISIPLHNRMRADDYNYVAEAILRLASA